MVPEPSDESRSAVLVIRAWVEPDAGPPVRARLLVGGPEEGPRPWSTALGEDAVCQEVRRWLGRLDDGGPDRGRPDGGGLPESVPTSAGRPGPDGACGPPSSA